MTHDLDTRIACFVGAYQSKQGFLLGIGSGIFWLPSSIKPTDIADADITGIMRSYVGTLFGVLEMTFVSPGEFYNKVIRRLPKTSDIPLSDFYRFVISPFDGSSTMDRKVLDWTECRELRHLVDPSYPVDERDERPNDARP